MNNMKIHLKDNGDPVECEADKRPCPKRNPDGTPATHYESKEEARGAFEQMMSKIVVTPHVMNIPKDVEEIFNLLESRGVQGYIVGGAVRDSLMSNVTPKDIDIEVQDVEDIGSLAELFKGGGYHVDEVGKAFAVLTLTTKSGIDIDVSLPRQDNHVGVGHKGFDVKVSPSLSLSDAALRRDFTINALYYNPHNKTIIDTHGGLKDWREGRLRHVSDAFSEDPLRVLRAAQFAGRFGLTIDEKTVAKARRISKSFHELPIERVRGEWGKLLKSKSLSKGLSALQTVGWAKFFNVENVDTKRVSDGIDLPPNLVAMAISRELPVEHRETFLHYSLNPKEAIAVLRGGKIDAPINVTKGDVYKFSRELDRSSLTISEWTKMNEIFHGKDEAIEATARAMGVFDGADKNFITGASILEKTGLTPGKWVGRLIADAQNAQDNSIFTTQAGADAWLDSRLNEARDAD